MLTQVDVTWTSVGNGGGGKTITGTGTAFDTDSHQFVPFYRSYAGGYLEDAPPSIHLVAGAVLHVDCAADYTATIYTYGGNNTYTTSTDAHNAYYCGWTPGGAGALTCNLGVATLSRNTTPDGTTLTVNLSGAANGTLRYALDGGVAQPSPVFRGVGPGPHTLVVSDTGLAGCERTLTVTIESQPLRVVPTGAPAGVDLVGQPVWHVPALMPAGAEVLLELWAETSHGAEDFALVHQLRKFATAAGQVSFRLDPLLWPLLSAWVPATGANLATTRCTTSLVNYFVRTSTYAPGQPPVYATSRLRTALRGALPAEWRGQDYFAYRLSSAFAQPPFLSWQPTGGGTRAAGQAKRITAQQPEWLFFLCPAPLATAQLRVRRDYLAAGSDTVFSEYENLTRPTPRGWAHRLLAIPVRPTRAGGATAAQVTVQLETLAGAPVSLPANYELVPATARTRYLLFTNSLGGVDTLRCEGRLEASLEATTDKAERPAQLSDGAAAADRQLFDVTAARKLKLATGWLKPMELDWLQELVLTREAWHQVGEQLRPLDVAKRSLATYSDEPTLRGLLLEFDYAYAPTAYAPTPYA